MSKLDTDYGPFVKLLTEGRVYTIPEYQRPYSWKPYKQVASIWSDVHRLFLSSSGGTAKIDGHFIGSVVLGSAPTPPLGPTRVPVIDGQQRLITLCLVIAAIRDRLIEDPRDKQAVTEQYLAHYKGGSFSELKVQPGKLDRPALEALVQGSAHYDKKSAIGKAYQYIAQQLAEGPGLLGDPLDDDAPDDEPSEVDVAQPLDGDGQGWRWETLIEIVGSKLELVVIADVPQELAYSIFASLNSKGMPLAQVDLVRNSVFMLLPKTGAEVHRSRWHPLEKMGSSDLQNYLHAWVIRGGDNVAAKDMYQAVLSRLSKSGGESNIRVEIDEIYFGAWAYALLTDPQTQEYKRYARPTDPNPSKPLIRQLERLHEWGTKTAEPLILELLERWRHQDIAMSTLLNCLAHLESFFVRRFIAMTPPNDLRSIFARVAQDAGRALAAQLESTLLTALLEENRRWTTDGAIETSLLTNPLYRAKATKQTFFILKRIAEALEGKEYPHIVHGNASGNYSIEHVLPQHLNDEWRTALLSWKVSDPTKLSQERLHVLGNLTITAYNSELSDRPFSEKKSYIEENLALKLSKDVLGSPQWTRHEIDARGRALAVVVTEIWSRPDV